MTTMRHTVNGKVIYARHSLADPHSTPKLAAGLKEFADYATK